MRTASRPAAETSLEVVTFDLEGQRYAIPSLQIVEVARAVAATPLPQPPPYVTGVINVRGQIVPLIDLRERFGLARRSLTSEDHLIIARTDRRMIAFNVDKVGDIANLSKSDLADIQDVAPGARYLSGVARLPGALLLIQDVERLLSTEEVLDIEQRLAQLGASPGEA